MQPAERTGPRRDQLVMSSRQEPQDLTVVLEGNRTQVPVPQRDDRSRAGVVRIGVFLVTRVQQSHPCRKCRRHVQHRLTRADELLRQQCAVTGRALHGPQSRVELRRPAQQSVASSAIGAHQELTVELFVAVDRDGGVRPLVRVDSNDEHDVLLDQKWVAAAGTPDAGMPFLFRATPQHGNRRADLSLGSQPEGGRAFSRPPAGTLDATKQPQRVTRTQPSGHYAVPWIT
jgi:hypothetical protein